MTPILIEPQPRKRLLPYKDPLNGLFWAEAGENPYESQRWLSPTGATTCIRTSELTDEECIQIDPTVDTLDYCTGPGCPGGENGCNAKGCDGVRTHFQQLHGDAWYWVKREV